MREVQLFIKVMSSVMCTSICVRKSFLCFRRAAESLQYLEKLGDREMTECPLCKETMCNAANPKVLPCTHTFCYKCLDQYWKAKDTTEKKPGEMVHCPLCRAEFVMPVGKISDFPTNHFIEKLSEARSVSRAETRNTPCSICNPSIDRVASSATTDLASSDSSSSTVVGFKNQATVYCVVCQQYMCKGCAKIHGNLTSSRSHQVVSLESQPEVEHLLRRTESRCDHHPDKEIEIYCKDCQTAFCSTCFISEHNKHNCVGVNEIADDLKRQIATDIYRIETLQSEISMRAHHVEIQMISFQESVDKAERDIVHRGKKLRRLVDKRVQTLLQELAAEKSIKQKEIEYTKDELQAQKFILESFRRYSQEILNKGAPSDIARVANDLNNRTRKLESLPFVKLKKTIDVAFIPSETDIQQFGSLEKLNVLGQLSCSKTYCKLSSFSVSFLLTNPINVLLSIFLYFYIYIFLYFYISIIYIYFYISIFLYIYISIFLYIYFYISIFIHVYFYISIFCECCQSRVEENTFLFSLQISRNILTVANQE